LSPPNLNALRVIIIVKKDIGFDGPWFNRFLKRHAACEKDGLYESLKRGKQQRFWSCAATCLAAHVRTEASGPFLRASLLQPGLLPGVSMAWKSPRLNTLKVFCPAASRDQENLTSASEAAGRKGSPELNPRGFKKGAFDRSRHSGSSGVATRL
jgi:hypothetical protein